MIRKLIVLSGCLFLSASVALAQTSIGGVVKDNTGAALVGVKVVASSPVLIEGSRTATTGGDGRYAIVDILPGAYTVTFTQQGFSTITQQIDVPLNVSVPLDATMQVGAASQTVEVKGQVATVDIENAAHPTEITRQELDSVPSARNMQAIGSSIPGVHLNYPDVGGTQQIQQTYMTAHGNESQDDPVYLDGLLVNCTEGDGNIQMYMDNEMFQDTTYQSGDINVDASSGGVEVSMVPKEGGNTFHSDIFLGYVAAPFVGTNITPDLVNRGVTAQGKTTELEDFDGSFGGPIKKDKLWFVLTGRDELTQQQSPIGKELDGSPGVDRSYIYDGSLRLTWAVTPKNKFTTMWMRDWKTSLHEFVTNTSQGVAAFPDATTRRTPVLYYIQQDKWSSTVTPRLLLEAGYARTNLDYNVIYQPGVYQTPFTPAWYTGTNIWDTTTNLLYNSGGGGQFYAKSDRNVGLADGVYVIGAHQIKFGLQDSWGPDWSYFNMNGDGTGLEASGIPYAFEAMDTPALQHYQLDADLGLYAMDVWHYKRLAITPGIRWEYLATEIQPESTPKGRWVPARSVAEINCNKIKGLGCYKDWEPRLGLVYDVFGDHKTAIKGYVGKYNIALVDSYLNNFNADALTSVYLTWNPACTGPTCVPYDQDIGANPNADFGLLQARTLNPNFHREYDMQYNLGVQRQLPGGLTGNFNWYHRSDYQQALTINSAVPASAWTPVQIQNPLNGKPITVYNLQGQYDAVTPVLYQTNAPRSLRANLYTGYETTVTGRLWHGGFIQAGWTYERQSDVDCDQTANNSLLNDPNSLRFCDWTGKLYQNLGADPTMPFRSEFKFSTNVPLWWHVEASANLYSDPINNSNFSTNIGITNSPMANYTGMQDGLQQVNWTISPSTTYPTDCSCSTPGALVDPGLTQGTETVLLVAPGAELDPRLNQLDIGIRRDFKVHDKYTAIGEVQIFNILNSSAPLAYSQTLGSTVMPYLPGGIGGNVSAVMNPRMFRLSGQFKF